MDPATILLIATVLLPLLIEHMPQVIDLLTNVMQ